MTCYICGATLQGDLQTWQVHYDQVHRPEVNPPIPVARPDTLYGLADYLASLEAGGARDRATLGTIGHLNRSSTVLTDAVQHIHDGDSFTDTIEQLDDVLRTLALVRQALTSLALEEAK